ncbi:hypothetical protein EDB83DRAFT_2556371 [Lactarius deliciosus]|nr:hypothetical protein EDB83DRAFT_2556371 [Lactarius deliciosus]
MNAKLLFFIFSITMSVPSDVPLGPQSSPARGQDAIRQSLATTAQVVPITKGASLYGEVEPTRWTPRGVIITPPVAEKSQVARGTPKGLHATRWTAARPESEQHRNLGLPAQVPGHPRESEKRPGSRIRVDSAGWTDQKVGEWNQDA